MRRAVAVGAVGVVLGLGLAGCSKDEPEDPLASLTQTPTVAKTTEATPEQEAFAAAEEVYRRHIALLDELGRDPGNKELLRKLGGTSTGVDKATAETEYGINWVDRGWHVESGAAYVRSVKLDKAELDKDPPQITLRTCLDASSAMVVDRKGQHVRKPGTPPMARVRVIVVQDDDRSWLVSHTLESKLAKTC